MNRDRRFRVFSLARLESVKFTEDGSVSVIGVSESGDAVAMVVHRSALGELRAGLEFPLPAEREAGET